MCGGFGVEKAPNVKIPFSGGLFVPLEVSVGVVGGCIVFGMFSRSFYDQKSRREVFYWRSMAIARRDFENVGFCSANPGFHVCVRVGSCVWGVLG